jgi:hypothetical protein
MENVIGAIVVGLVEALIFRVLWKKKVPALRNIVSELVKANKKTAAHEAAGLVKKALDKSPATKAVLDSIIGEAHAYVKPDKP